MLSKNIIKKLIANATPDAIINLMAVTIEHLSITEYNDKKVINLLGIICGDKLKTKDDVDLNYVNTHYQDLIYISNKSKNVNLSVNRVDNYAGIVEFNIRYIDENGNNIETSVNISYLDNPKILK